MTIEMQEMLEREMDDAIAITESSRRDDAMKTVTLHYLKALCDCQRKTAERVKQLVVDADRKAERVKGFQVAVKVGKYLVASGLGAGLVKLLSAV